MLCNFAKFDSRVSLCFVPIGIGLLTFVGMVKEINATAVALEDKLTDSVYIWKDGTISQFLN